MKLKNNYFIYLRYEKMDQKHLLERYLINFFIITV